MRVLAGDFAGGLQRGDQGAVALEAGTLAQVQRVLAAQLIFDAEQLAAEFGGRFEV